MSIWHRKPPKYEDGGSLGSDYILRCVALRRAGLIGIVLVEPGPSPQYYIAGNAADPWGSRKFISRSDLRDLIDEIEPQTARSAA